jgi:hypothetical protein
LPVTREYLHYLGVRRRVEDREYNFGEAAPPLLLGLTGRAADMFAVLAGGNLVQYLLLAVVAGAGTLTIEYSYDIRQLDISHNNRSAGVEIATTLKMGEEFMEIFSESTDRIERSMRKVQLVAQDAKVHIRWTPGAIAHREQYFRAR